MNMKIKVGMKLNRGRGSSIQENPLEILNIVVAYSISKEAEWGFEYCGRIRFQNSDLSERRICLGVFSENYFNFIVVWIIYINKRNIMQQEQVH